MPHIGDAFGFVGQLIEPMVRVEARVGEGGFSVVYRGRHMGLNEDVAVKAMKLPPGLAPPVIDQLVERFRAESRISYRLSQGNLDIVRSISSGTAVSPALGIVVPYIVLEWLEGHSLAQDFKARRAAGMTGRLLPEVLELMDPAVLALDYAHRQGVVHRDIKPGNLFLADTRDGTRLKVLDFGLAKVVDPDGLGLLPSAHTMPRTAFCSPSYGAPEQFDPKLGPVGTYTDVYGLALVVLEALCDRKARPAESVAHGARLALDPNALVTATSLGLKLPPKIEVLLARAVSLDKRMRPQTAGELWSEFKGLTLKYTARARAQAAAKLEGDRTEFQPEPSTSPVMPVVPRTPLPPHEESAMSVSPVASTMGPTAPPPTASPPSSDAATLAIPGAPIPVPPPTPTPNTAPMRGAPPRPSPPPPQQPMALGGTVIMPDRPANVPKAEQITLPGPAPRRSSSRPPPAPPHLHAPPPEAAPPLLNVPPPEAAPKAEPPRKRSGPAVLVVLVMLAALVVLGFAIYRLRLRG